MRQSAGREFRDQQAPAFHFIKNSHVANGIEHINARSQHADAAANALKRGLMGNPVYAQRHAGNNGNAAAERQRAMYSATDLPCLVALREPTTAKPGDCSRERSPPQ